MTALEVGTELVALCSEGKFMEAIQSLYAEEIVSVEAMAPPGASREVMGLEAVFGKPKWWQEKHEMHGAKLEGPLATGKHFCVRFTIDVTFKPAGQRMTMDELALYEVKDGKSFSTGCR
jgi:hypothetical protein